MKKYIAIFLCATMIITSCGPTNSTVKGTAIGGGAGATVGAIIGALISKDAKGAAIGAAIGTAVGAGSGALIGHKMDKKAEQLAAELENATVETVQDSNGLEAIKVTFNSGILFPVGKAELSANSKKELDTFATQMADLPDTDIKVYGHTDNTGSAAVNEKLSLQRAQSVSNYLASKGIASSRILTQGLSYNEPIASNDTEEGRAQNRRVEVYVFANDKMVEAANNGTLK